MSSDLQFKGYAIHSTKGDAWHDFKVIDFEPKPEGEYDITIKINYCGICSSDVHTLSAGWGEPILPLISGHEIAGKVVKVGSKVTEFKVGDRAGVGAQVCSCFKCTPCKTDNENFCEEGGVDTYNAKYSDGSIAHGGYATGVRVHERFVFKIPDELADEDVAPMFCGGLTSFSPLKRFGAGPGKKVAIAGLGGLGHYGVMFAKALGAEVTVFSHQANKKEDALKMGAKDFVLTTEKDFAKKHAFKFDILLSTIDDAAGIPITDFFSMLKLHGHMISVGLPDKPFEPFQPQAMASNGCQLCVTHIGSKKECYEMLQIAVKNNIKTWKEVIPMKDVGKGVVGVKNNDVRYRYVLKVDI